MTAVVAFADADDKIKTVIRRAKVVDLRRSVKLAEARSGEDSSSRPTLQGIQTDKRHHVLCDLYKPRQEAKAQTTARGHPGQDYADTA